MGKNPPEGMEMKTKLMQITVVLTLFAAVPILSGLAPFLDAHLQVSTDYRKAVSEADAVALAVVESASIQESRCSTLYNYRLKALERVRGDVEPGRDYPFSYGIYHWRPARFFWQEDCPSVSYTIPNVARAMKRGDRVIMTLERLGDGGSLVVTSTIDMEQLVTVKQIPERK